MWSSCYSVCTLLSQYCLKKVSHMSRFNLTRVLQDEAPLNGLTTALVEKNMDNRMEVNVSSTSNQQIPPEMVCNQKVDQHYLEVLENNGLYIEISFKDLYLKPSGYTLQTAPVERAAHPKSWRLIGYEDNGSPGFILNEQSDYHDLNGYNKVKSFRITSAQYYSRFRLYVSESWEGTGKFVLQRIELFGNLLEKRD